MGLHLENFLECPKYSDNQHVPNKFVETSQRREVLTQRMSITRRHSNTETTCFVMASRYLRTQSVYTGDETVYYTMDIIKFSPFGALSFPVEKTD